MIAPINTDVSQLLLLYEHCATYNVLLHEYGTETRFEMNFNEHVN